MTAQVIFFSVFFLKKTRTLMPLSISFLKIFVKELSFEEKQVAQIEQFWFQTSASTFSLKSSGQCLQWWFYQLFCR